jgi:hypothetical protein
VRSSPLRRIGGGSGPFDAYYKLGGGCFLDEEKGREGRGGEWWVKKEGWGDLQGGGSQGEGEGEKSN